MSMSAISRASCYNPPLHKLLFMLRAECLRWTVADISTTNRQLKFQLPSMKTTLANTTFKSG